MKTITLKSGEEYKLNTPFHGDFMELAAKLPDNCIGLLMIDPPYFEVKGDFDFIWESFEDYLKDVERWAIECKRILADNGSLFWWGHAKKIAYSQIILDKYFHLENVIKWEKKECQTKRQDFEQSRCFAPVTEHCLFYSNEVGMTGREFIEKEYIAPRNPFAIELKKMRIKNNYSIKYLAEYGKFYGNVNHGGAVTNWEKGYNVPLQEQWEKLSEILYLSPYDNMRKEYQVLRMEYDGLRSEYEVLRRPFNNGEKLTDVIKHSQESHISKNYDHETIKPVGLIKRLLQVTTRKDTVVFIPFWGSGTDSEACHELGLDWIACEIEKKHFDNSNKRQTEKESQPLLEFS